jgi:ribonuclease III
MTDLNVLYDQLGYHFKNPELLQQALRHRSAGQPNNERLEFLGDALLNAIMAIELYKVAPTVEEGTLSSRRAHLVNGAMLAQIAREFNLGHFLQLGPGEMKNGGQNRDSILADAVEAVIGAIYLDSNIELCHASVLHWFSDRIQAVIYAETVKDAKSQLQEWLQAQQLPLPDYKVRVSGKSHQQTFLITCRVAGLSHTTQGISNSRRKAEQQAAKQFLEWLIKR